MTRTKSNRILAIFAACLVLLSCLFFVPAKKTDAASPDEFLAGFKQTVYDQESGLGSTEVNCIYQTASGYIWIGTDGGLYRFNGKEFRIFNQWNTEKDDVYFINNLFQDTEGRLWVSTENYGLFYIQGSKVEHFTDAYYSGVKCIYDVCQTPDGTIYVGTNVGLYTVDPENTQLRLMEQLAGKSIRDLTIAGGNLWGITGVNGFFLLSDQGNVVQLKASDFTQEEVSCIRGMPDGTVYVGTPGTEILHISRTFSSKSYYSGKDGINSLYHDGKRLFVCADSGMGYFDTSGTFHSIYDAEVNRYISCMIKDYEGNYWFASSRMGVLLLGRSKFRNYNEYYGLPQTATNCITSNGTLTFLGTDDGLTIIRESDMSVVQHDLVTMLSGASIRDIMLDSSGNLWISTSRRFGVVRYKPKGLTTNFGRNNLLTTNQVNCTLELSDGRIAIATEEGIAILNKDDTLDRAYSVDQGLKYPNILCMYQAPDGRLFAGSDGGGLYVIKGDDIKNYTDDDGLTSNVVSDIVPGESGIWIGTDNGLSIFTEGIRPVSNIDFSNNIYDLILEEPEEGKSRLWVMGSKGVLCATEEELLGTAALEGRYLAQGDGLAQRLSLNCHCRLEEGLLYLCCSNGVMTLPTASLEINEIPPKLTVSEINVDDQVFHLEQLGGSLTIPSETQRLAISFAVLSYTNRENVVVEYRLEGFDGQNIKISPSDPMQAVYTNLDGGTYTFKVRAINGDGIVSTQDITFTINKEYGFFEKQSTKNLLLAVAALVAILIIVSIYSLTRRMRGQDREIEKLEKEHEVAVKSSTAKSDFLAHMSNEIKIPVNAIISLADTIQREQSEEVRREGLQAIATSGQEILGKVDETIELARLESGRVAAVNAPYSITTLVCDISDRMINLLDQKPVRFLVDLGEHIPDILVGDYEKIRRVLEILLDNAGKYTREGTITLFVDYYEIPEAKGKNRLIFNISDTGIGIQKERLEHIFEVYNIADSKKQAGYTGSGISLTIANQLTATMGGEIEVESTYGAGSTFTVTLPQEMADQNMVASTFAGEAGLRITREEAERMAAPDVAVLLVDDVEISRTVALGVLRQLEIEADVADSGMRALDLAMNRQYDIIFMDLAMPVMNGTDAMKELREMEGAKDVPIIAMTEDALNEDRDALEKAGFSDMIVKPLELTVLAEILAQNTPEKLGPKERKIPVYTENVQNLEGLQELEAYLDVSGVLEKIGGSVEVYNRILSTFYSQNQNAEEELKEKFSDNYRSFRSRIHNIRNGAQNVGAIELQNHIQRIDSAINIGNKGYVRDNLPMLLTLLGDVLKAIRVYLDQTTEQRTVAEQVDRQKEKKPEKRSQIDFAILDAMLEAAEQGDPEALKDGLAEISFDIYENEDTEFLQVLKETVEKQDMAGVTDLIGTYKELKK